MISSAFRIDQETADKIVRIAAHQGIISGGMSGGIREAIDVAYEKLKPKMTKSTLAKKYVKK